MEISFRYESSKLFEKLERMVMPYQEMMQGEPALESNKLPKFEVVSLEEVKALSSYSEESEANQKDQPKVSCECGCSGYPVCGNVYRDGKIDDINVFLMRRNRLTTAKKWHRLTAKKLNICYQLWKIVMMKICI